MLLGILLYVDFYPILFWWEGISSEVDRQIDWYHLSIPVEFCGLFGIV
jgi:hypothetical protein